MHGLVMAVSILQQQTIAATPGDWAQTLVFNQFDPSAGDLLDAVFTTAGTVDASASIENLAPVAATVSLGVGAEIEASVPAIGESVASLTPIAVASVNLPAFQGTFDGTLDFAGPSGTVVPNFTASQTETAAIPLGTSVAGPLLGAGTFDVDVSSYAISTVEGNGNLAVLLHGSVGAVLSLQYDAATPSEGSSSSSGVIINIFDGPLPSPVMVGPNIVIGAEQVVTLQPQTSGSGSTASFAQFNPALGKLDAILLSVGNTVSGTFSAENLETMPARVSMTENASMTVASPGDAAGVTADAGTSTSFSLGAYDGSADFSGSSGQSETLPAVSGLDPIDGTQLTDSLDLNAFTGTGTIALPVSTAGTSTVTGPSNLLEEITQQTGGTVSVSYVYTPFTGTSGAGSETPGPLGDPGDDRGPFGRGDGLPRPDPIAQAAVPAVFKPGLAFLGGLMGRTFVTAQSDQTFLIGSAATETINDFSLGDGDKLDLSVLLAGAPLTHDLSNLGSFLNVTGQSGDEYGGGTSTTLAVNGPAGAASLVLVSTGSISVVDLLSSNALVLPSH
jgi:hypothetical protein